MAEILLKNGAQIDAKLTDESGSTPLDLALKAGEKLEKKMTFITFVNENINFRRKKINLFCIISNSDR